MAAGISSQIAFGVKPSQLDQPVPGEQEQIALDQSFDEVGTPQLDAPAVSAPEEVDPLDQFLTPERETDPLDQFLQEEVPEEDAEGAAFDALPIEQRIRDGVNESLARAKVSFGVTPEEKLQAAKSIFPGAVLEGGEIFRKSKATGKLVPLDEDSIEIIDDTLDFTRDIIEGIVETIGTIGGGTAAAVAGGPAAPVTGFVGTAAAGAASAVAALEVGDFIQESVLGIKRDPERLGRIAEGALAATFGGAFNILGSSLARRGATKLARKANLEKLSTAGGEEAVNAVSLAKEAIKEVQDAGLAKNINGEILLTPNQINPTNPEMRIAAESLANQPGFRSFMAEQGRVLNDAYQTVAAAVGNAGSDKTGLGKAFVESIGDITKAEGKLIGRFREEALKASKGEPAPVNNFRQLLGETIKELGLDPDSASKGIDKDLILDIFPDLTDTQAGTLGKKLSTLTRLINNSPNGLPFKMIDTEYKKLTNSIDLLSNGSTGKPLAYKLIGIKNALRDDWTQAIGERLGPESQQAYQAALGKFSKIKGASSEINTLLKNDNISKEALAKKLFTGQTSLKNIRNVKTIIQEDNPELWKDLTFEFIDGLKQKHTNPDTFAVNWQGLSKEFDKIGSEAKKEIFDGTEFSKEQFDSLIKLGRLTNLGEVEIQALTKNKGVYAKVKNLILATFTPFLSTKIDNSLKLMEGFGKDKALAKFLSAGGLEEVAQNLPKAKRNRFLNYFQPIVDQIASTSKATLRVGEAVTGPALRTEGRRVGTAGIGELTQGEE